ncbi:MAG: type III pantothenate kinase [bacterium]
MLLAIDVGNTSVVFGLFQGKKLVREWRCPTLDFKFPNIKAKVDQIIVASVVPALDRRLKAEGEKRFGLKPFFVTARNIPGIGIRMRDKNEVGADRVVDALAAYTLYKGSCIVVDFGTATTFDVISKAGEYLGGAIAPGIALARDALFEQTAKLPKVKIEAPKRVIGNDTVSAMQSGLVYGYVSMVEGMVKRLGKGCKVIATGGYAKLICKYTKVVDRIDEKLTLKGLRIIADDLEMGKA